MAVRARERTPKETTALDSSSRDRHWTTSDLTAYLSQIHSSAIIAFV